MGGIIISSLRLSDEMAQELIKVLKSIFKKHSVNLESKPHGTIKIETIDKRGLTLHYNISTNVEGKYSIHLMDNYTKHTLIRLNVSNDTTFHKNASGEKIYGNRLNIFSSEEYILKNDGHTHYRAHPLPYEELDVDVTFIGTLDNFLTYTNTLEKNKIVVNQTSKQLRLF